MRSFLRVAAAAALAAVALVVLPATAAHASAPTAMDKCLAGATPEYHEFISHPGNAGGASFPDGVNPDNAIFPGDVVRVTIWDSITYNTWGDRAWPDGNGVPAPAGFPYPGLNGFSSVAMWNNNPLGWVGSPVQTTSLGTCTAAPAGIPVRLLFGINDPWLTDNGGQWFIYTELFRAPGRVAVDGVEVTQGVQTPRNEVPLIAEKRTFVRVYVRGTDDDLGALSRRSAPPRSRRPRWAATAEVCATASCSRWTPRRPRPARTGSRSPSFHRRVAATAGRSSATPRRTSDPAAPR
jgi:hypothetical protein